MTSSIEIIERSPRRNEGSSIPAGSVVFLGFFTVGGAVLTYGYYLPPHRDGE